MRPGKTIIKRDGQIVPYDRSRTTNAIFKAAASTGGFGFDEADRLSLLVEQRTAESYAGQIPTVEDLQDIVEAVLMGNQHLATARAYIELINRHLEQLLAGATIKTPHYDFHSGKRTLNVHEMRMEEGEILLMDCLHGLFSDMTRSVPDNHKFQLYIETLGQLRNGHGEFMRWADHRLLRRMNSPYLRKNCSTSFPRQSFDTRTIFNGKTRSCEPGGSDISWNRSERMWMKAVFRQILFSGNSSAAVIMRIEQVWRGAVPGVVCGSAASADFQPLL